MPLVEKLKCLLHAYFDTSLQLVSIPLPTRLLRPEMAPLSKWKRIVVSFVCLMLLTWFLVYFKIESGRRAVDRAYDSDSPINHWVTVTVSGHEDEYTDTSARTESRRSQHNRDDVKLITELKNWPSDSFCEDFLENTFNYKMPVCTDGSDRIVCYGTPHNPSMSTCTMQGVALVPKSAFYLFHKFESIWLRRETPEEAHECSSHSYTDFDKHIDRGDYLGQIVKKAGSTVPKGECQIIIPGTSFVYAGSAVHIFFKFLVWYNLFKSMKENNATDGTAYAIRLPEGKDAFLFPEFEKHLFPGLIPVEEIDNSTSIYCFEKLVLVPWAYTSVHFQCKNKGYLRGSCYKCNGSGLEGTAVAQFRRKVLSVCFLSDRPLASAAQILKKIVVVVRKPYHRFTGDNPQRFRRSLTNSDELIEGLKQEFPTANVTAVQMEGLSLCEQIRLAHEADVLMGVHGAGLVHLWWMHHQAILFELLPQAQVGNPTFKMLSTLTGQRYHEHLIPNSYNDATITVDVAKVVEDLRKLYPQTVYA